MRVWILSTGDELVRGRTRDTNTAEIAEALGGLGLTVVGASLVGDDEAELVDAIGHGASRADLLVMSGGLGPTEDDCTRRAAARAAGVDLVRDDGVVDSLRARFRAMGRQMPESNLLQADLPRGAEVIRNAFGTAPGFSVAIGAARFFALPGPPREMRGVLQQEILPRLRALCGEGGRVVRTLSLETFGKPEAAVGELLGDLMARDRRPRIGTTATEGTIRVVVHEEGAPAEVHAAIEATMSELRRRLGDLVYGEDGVTLAQVVGRRLIATGTTLSTAESCTGGGVAASLTSVPGISAVFPGGVVAYANEEKVRLLGVPAALIEEHGVVSEQVARAMASGARERFATDLGLGITGIAGPDGGTVEKPVGLVHLALAAADGVTHRRVVLPGDRDLVRTLTVKCALDLVRRKL